MEGRTLGRNMELTVRVGVEVERKLELGIMVHKPSVYICEFVLAIGPLNFWLQVMRG